MLVDKPTGLSEKLNCYTFRTVPTQRQAYPLASPAHVFEVGVIGEKSCRGEVGHRLTAGN